MLTTYAANLQEPFQVWYLVFSTAGFIVAVLSHWRFRTGWHMREGWLSPGELFFPTYLCLLYGALPAAVSAGGMTLGLTLIWADLIHASVFFEVLFLLSWATFMVGGMWIAKEFFWPTRRRTPDWLREEEGR